jgi:hypothetical protein
MQNNTANTAAVPAKDEFVKVEGGGPDRTSAEGSVVVAYSLMWAIMVVFVWRTYRALRALGVEADKLMHALKKGAL